MMRLGIDRLLFALALAAPPSSAVAQTCGWDAADIAPDGLPHAIVQLVARAGSGASALDESLGRIRSWVRSCDGIAMRRAILELRNRADQRRGDNVLNALAGIALARGPEVQVEGATGYLLRATYPNSNAERDAVRRLSAVLGRTGWSEVASELAALALATRGEFALEHAYDAIADAAADAPTLWIHAADLALARGDLDAARAAAMRVPDSERPAAHRVSAIADLVTRTAADRAATAYLAALDSADDMTMRRYYDDLIPLLTDGEIEAYAALPPEERARWLQRAWEWRASISTLPVPSRLAVHFTRMDSAFVRFRRQSFRDASYGSAWLMGKLPPLSLDDRGIVYLRHGAPDDVARLGIPFSTDRAGGETGPSIAREAWLYRRLGGGRAVLEFVQSTTRADYFLGDPANRNCGALPRTAAADIYGQKLDEFRGYGIRARPELDRWSDNERCYATRAGDTLPKYYTPFALANLTETAVLQTESAEPRFRTPIDALVSAYAMKRGFDTELITFLWVDGAGLTAGETTGRFDYALPIFVAAEDHVARRSTRVDTTMRVQRATPLQRGDIVRTMVGIERAPIGDLTIRASIRNSNDATQGQILLMHKVVPEFRSGFTLSDIVIADTIDGPWTRGPVSLAPLPAHVVAEGARFRLYYELYGIEPGESVNVQLIIAPVGRSGIAAALRNLIDQRRAVRIDFSDAPIVQDGIGHIRQEIAPNLEPGEYSVEVSVTRARNSEAAVTSANLVVVEL